ncbi:MAG: type III pantothenate kinase [Acidobacteria bacterium]|nr:type III pantothenate kinase [Acidobacteriota bacterium]
MLLAIDVGNTHTVIGIIDDKQLIHAWRLTTQPARTGDEYGILFRSLMEPAGIDVQALHGGIISCVVPPLLDALTSMCERTMGIDPLVVGPGIRTGIPLRVDQPHEVGADRIVNAAAAIELHGTPAIVVDFGTATTFDPISKEGEFLGGAIAPGLQISAEALNRKASKLPRVEFKRPKRVIGKNTVENIQSGLFFGYVGLVDGILEAMRGEMDGTPRVIATGGLGRHFVTASKFIEVYEENLTLEGLRILYERNQIT